MTKQEMLEVISKRGETILAANGVRCITDGCYYVVSKLVPSHDGKQLEQTWSTGGIVASLSPEEVRHLYRMGEDELVAEDIVATTDGEMTWVA